MNGISFIVVATCVRPVCAQQSPQESSSHARRKNQSSHGAPPKQAFVVLMRHGMTDWNLAGRVQGNLDESRLNDVGIEQARLAGRRLRHIPFDAVYCSPLSRARQTFRLLATASENASLQIAVPRFLDGLTEIEFPWQGYLRRDIKHSEWRSHFAAYRHNPRTFSFNGFNPVRDIERRAYSVWHELRASQSRCSLVVAHNQTNKALMAAALGLHTNLHAWNQTNCCANVVALCSGQYPVLRLCNSAAPPVSTAPQRRPMRRSGFTRIILHQHGAIDRFAPELFLGNAVHLYAIGEDAYAHARELEESGATPGWSPLPFLSRGKDDDTLFAIVVTLLRRIRVDHANRTIGITTADGRIIAAFFAAAFNLGATGLQRVHSDPGGVTIVDVAAVRPSDLQYAKLECFNIPPFEADDALIKYTTPFEPC